MWKPDSQDFSRCLDQLRCDPSLVSRYYWLGYLFHITDVENAAEILDLGQLLSRAELDRSGLRWVDAASSSVIRQTDEALTEFVRLYFRPKTPTAYHMEGIKPVHRLYTGGAHCPLPVYFVFAAGDVLSMSAARFSDGNIASSATNIFESADDFAKLPFKDIYHDRGWSLESEGRKGEIRNRRHAEVIYPNALGLESLKWIVCRSQAEYDSLRTLLGHKWEHWKSIVVTASKPTRLFYLNWLFVNSVVLTGSKALVEFNLPNHRDDYGPFYIRVSIVDRSTGKSFGWEQHSKDITNDLPNIRLRLDLSAIRSRAYSFKLEVDGKLAYLGQYEPEIPF